MNHNKIKILIADSSPYWREYLGSLFSKENYIVNNAASGEEAIEFYRSFRPHIMILDLNLVGKSGREVIDHIRNKMVDDELYILILTTEDDVEKKADSLNLGANDFLLKPFARDELQARINVAKRHLRLNSQLRLAYEQISREIDTVAYLQNKLLPDACLWSPEISVECIYRPSGRASGDYYDHFALKENVLRAVIADVSGHGARAAFLMAIVRSLIRTTERYYLNLKSTLNLVNKQLLQTIGNEIDFVTIFAADIDTKNNTLTYINAGHCPGILCTRDNKLDILGPTTTVLGFFDLKFSLNTIDISDKWGLLLFTDGFYEWKIAPHNVYGLDNFINMASRTICSCNTDFSLDYLEKNMIKDLEANPIFSDDRSAMLIKWQPVIKKIFQSSVHPSACKEATQKLCSFLKDYLKEEETINDIKLAVIEACSNVCLHAYSDIQNGDIEIRSYLQPGVLIKLEIVDWGKPFTGPTEKVFQIRPEDESGRGIYIISQIMDEYNYQRCEGQNILTMIKHIEESLWKH